MANKAAVRAQRNKRVSRFEKISDEELAGRWQAALPRFMRWILIFGLSSLGIFLYDHFVRPQGNVHDVLSVAFQITLIFGVCFTLLYLMGLHYARAGKKR